MTNEFCSDCGQALSAGARFCSNCGHPAGSGSGPSKDQTSVSGNWRRDGLIVLGVLVVISASYLFTRETPQQVAPAQVTSPDGHEGMGASLTDLPTDYAGLIDGGNQHMDAGNFPMAAEMYKRALAIDGSSPDVRTDFGACLHSMGLAPRALEEFRTVYQEHPGHALVRFNMGIVHFGENRLDSARHYWEEFLQMQPEGEAAETARGYLEGMK